ncbi:MAG: TlpA family protein disulfide reductase, partial [Aestuariivirgaceae bacterium]
MSKERNFGMNPRQIAIMIGCFAGLLAAVYGIYSISSQQRNAKQQLATGQSAHDGQMTLPDKIPSTVTRELATGKLAAFVIKPERKPVADIEFVDETGANRSISQWRGSIVLLNLWATWCAPCRKEMPELAELQKLLGGDEFEVVALSIDRKGAEASAKFLIDIDATALKLYVDSTAESLGRIQGIGLPVTLLIDRQGNEIGRLTGPADWSSPDALRLILTALKEG